MRINANQNATEVPEFVNEATMTLQEFGNMPLFSITLSQLESILRYWAYQIRTSVTTSSSPGPLNYMTRKEAAAMLHISLPTLHRYTKSGIIRCKKIGTRILFATEEIEEACKTIETKKNNR